MNFVLDASVALSWCFEDEGGDDALRILDILRSSEAITAPLWPLEVANGLLTAQRRGRVEPARAARLLDGPLAEAARAEGVERIGGH